MLYSSTTAHYRAVLLHLHKHRLPHDFRLVSPDTTPNRFSSLLLVPLRQRLCFHHTRTRSTHNEKASAVIGPEALTRLPMLDV